MGNNELQCPICGEPTRIWYGNARTDRLCGKHADMLKNGEILIDEKGNFIEAKTHKILNQTEMKNNSSNMCIICGNNSNGKHFCFDCYKGIKIFNKDITHLNTIYQAKEYYYNLKNSIFWINKMEYAQEACKKLFAIAEIIDEFKNINQKDTATKDITYLLTKKKAYLNIDEKPEDEVKTTVEHDELHEVNEEIADYRRMYPATIRCKDGHYVRSNNEKTIDDRLYERRVFHEYETRYKAVDGQAYYPDFYIPDAKLFIEYFGVSESKEKNEKKKQLFLQDKKYKFEFIPQEKVGVLDDAIYDIIEKYNLD